MQIKSEIKNFSRIRDKYPELDESFKEFYH